VFAEIARSGLVLPTLEKGASALMRGFSKASSSHRSRFPKATAVDNFCRFVKNVFYSYERFLEVL
jgi:hypothetical protein